MLDVLIWILAAALYIGIMTAIVGLIICMILLIREMLKGLRS
jgi:hypothetical protein